MVLPPVIRGVVMGIVATLSMDIVGGILAKARIIRLLPIGRWAAYLLRGTYRHADITKSPSLRGERGIAPLVHYAIGVSLASFYLAAVGWIGLEPAWWTAIGYGLLTSVLPYVIMFPSMGYGFFGLRGEPKYFLLRQSLISHFVFGVGLSLGVLLL